MARRELLAVRSPHGVEGGHLRSLRGPAELRDVGARSAERRQQADRRRVGRDRLLLVEEQEIVDLRALEVDRAHQRRRADADSRAEAKAADTELQSLRASPERSAAIAAAGPAAACPLRSCCSADWRSGNSGSPPTSSRAAPARSAPPRGSCSCYRSLAFDPLGNGVVALAAPRVAAQDAPEGHPAPARGAIALDCGDRIGRTARLVAAAGRQDLRRSFLPALATRIISFAIMACEAC